MKENKPICYLLVGLPGSGKSKLAQDILVENPDYIWVSSDVYIDKIAQETNKKYDEVYRELSEKAQKWANAQLQEGMKEKKGIIWDQTNVFENARKRKVSNLLQHKYDVICLALELSPEELQYRHNKRKKENGKRIPYKVFQEMFENYTTPTYAEGFTEIYIINDKSELKLIENIKVKETSYFKGKKN